jgi:hypothetical protein
VRLTGAPPPGPPAAKPATSTAVAGSGDYSGGVAWQIGANARVLRVVMSALEDGRQLGAIGHGEFGVRPGEVVVDGANREVQPLGNDA